MNSSVSQSPHYSSDMKDSLINTFSRHQIQNNFAEPNNNNIYFTSMEPTDLSFKTAKNLSKKRTNNETDCESVSSEGAWTENSDNCSTSLSMNSHVTGSNKRAKMANRSVLSSPISNRSSSPSNHSGTSSPVTAESYSNLSNDCSPVNLSQSANSTEKDSDKSTSTETKSKDPSSGSSSSGSSTSSGPTKSKPKPLPISAIPIPTFPQSLQTPIVTYASPFLAKHTPAMLNNFAFFSSLSPLSPLHSPRYGNGTHFQFPIGATPPTPTSIMSMPPLSPFSTAPFSPSIFDPQLILPSPSKSIPVLQ